MVCICIFFSIGLSYGKEIKSRFTTISYDNPTLLRAFNNSLKMGRLRYLLRGKNILTVEDEVKHKVDVVAETVCEILEMRPSKLRFSIALLTDRKGVRKVFIRLHGKNWERAGFYHTPNNTVYLSVADTNLRVLAHELGHVVVEHYFEVSPPVKVHELLAQFAEKHITQ